MARICTLMDGERAVMRAATGDAREGLRAVRIRVCGEDGEVARARAAAVPMPWGAMPVMRTVSGISWGLC